MKGEKYRRYLDVIYAHQKLKSFTTKTVSLTLGLSQKSGVVYTREMLALGLIEFVSKKTNKFTPYRVSKGAEKKLNQMFSGEKQPEYVVLDEISRECPKLDFETGGKVVKKANVKGLGNAFFKRFDSLVREVRCG
ncbi:hypothetical protein [Morganella psychrotolerans]|uniref:Uncharacterized protein n=1 Tax=Morganella psychrotolerans TaxID=368603 RepID=A0A1B8H895_9GAMM|nr:hypothetical protein [Morganella psychrotolerans]OBU05304.1 hypothetical protein AYY18_20045 [Morganella psychrotolerans]